VGEKSVKDALINWIRDELKRRSAWVYIEQHGGYRGYHTGYMHALKDVLEVLKKKGGDDSW